MAWSSQLSQVIIIEVYSVSCFSEAPWQFDGDVSGDWWWWWWWWWPLLCLLLYFFLLLLICLFGFLCLLCYAIMILIEHFSINIQYTDNNTNIDILWLWWWNCPYISIYLAELFRLVHDGNSARCTISFDLSIEMTVDIILYPIFIWH